MRIIVGISGASGVVMGYEMLKALRMQEDCEIHLVITQGAIENFKYETDMEIKEVMKLADYCYDDKNMAASISSGSFRTDGMIVIPCSMRRFPPSQTDTGPIFWCGPLTCVSRRAAGWSWCPGRCP